MSHRHTVIEPAEGLTVLVGPNNCGKSAFVTALQIVCHNSASGFVLRHGEKKCEVIVETQDGHVVQWSRKKNGAGTYVVDGQRFDRLRGKVPEAVHQVLKMPMVLCDKDEFDIHFGEQSDPVFLLKDRGKAAAQFFASSSDATHLVTMQHEHKSNVTIAKRDFKRLSNQQDQIQKQLDTLVPLEELDQRVAAAEKQHTEILKTNRQTESLQILAATIQASGRKLQYSTQLFATLGTLSKPPQLSAEQPLKVLIDHVTETTRLQAASLKRCVALEQLDGPPQLKNTGGLELLTDNFRNAEYRLKMSQGLTMQLAPIEPPPKLAADQALEHLLNQLQHKTRANNSAAAMAETLAHIEIPQPQTPIQPIEHLIQRLSQCQRVLAVAESKLTQVESATQPPSLTDTTAIEQVIHDIGEKSNAVAQRNNSLDSVKQRLQTVQDAIDDWVKSNPACPTCGSPTSQSKLADHTCSQKPSAQGHARG
jgi:exonuclease SbcC